ncbi:MAG: flagellar basal body rod protein FlgC [Deltaproteobacteria bacterium]|jgi:flagellar basal-body rod protein FlgC|nr:flagellar basal body rod protein FlgC [Deltaproteobacteria bacterium]
MNVFSAMEVLSSGLEAQRTRLNVVSSNLANANTTKTEAGGPYKRKDAVFASQPVQGRFNELMNDSLSKNVQMVKTVDIVEDNAPPRFVFDPEHPDANADGYVAYPDISMVEEMVNMMMASRAYEASTTAMQTMTTAARSALKI